MSLRVIEFFVGARVAIDETRAAQLTGMIEQIRTRIDEAEQVSVRAVRKVGTTGGSVRTPAEGAERIGAVIGMIDGIVAQTRMLALSRGDGLGSAGRPRRRLERSDEPGVSSPLPRQAGRGGVTAAPASRRRHRRGVKRPRPSPGESRNRARVR